MKPLGSSSASGMSLGETVVACGRWIAGLGWGGGSEPERADGAERGCIGALLRRAGAADSADETRFSVDGSGHSADGTRFFVDGSERFADGMRHFASGSGRFADGMRFFVDGFGHSADGTRFFASGSGHSVDGMRHFVDGSERSVTGFGPWDWPRGPPDGG